MMTHATMIPLAAPSTLPEAQQAKTMAAAQKFEAMALDQMLQPMFDTADTSGSTFGGGAGERTWKPMLVNEMATNIVKSGGLGLTQPVYQQMLRLQEGAQDATGDTGQSTGESTSPTEGSR